MFLSTSCVLHIACHNGFDMIYIDRQAGRKCPGSNCKEEGMLDSVKEFGLPGIPVSEEE